MGACVEQVAAALSLARMHVVGYSMGGRVALSLAVAHPDRVASLLLVGASPGLAEAEERAARIKADEALARQIEQDGLERFVDYWMALPLFASQSVLGEDALARARTQRLRSDPAGLANSLRGMGHRQHAAAPRSPLRAPTARLRDGGLPGREVSSVLRATCVTRSRMPVAKS